jgi:hypothetical protein
MKMKMSINSEHPAFGDFAGLLSQDDQDSAFSLWLDLHALWNSREVFQTMVLRECLPSPETLLEFSASEGFLSF